MERWSTLPQGPVRPSQGAQSLRGERSPPSGWLAILAFREEPQCPRVWRDKEGLDPQAPWEEGDQGPGEKVKIRRGCWGAWLGSNHSGLDPPPVSTSSRVALG